MLTRIARLTGRHPRLVLAGWLLVVGLSLPFAARVGNVLTAQPGTAPHSVAKAVRTVLRAHFALPDDYNVVLVAHGIGTRVGQPAFDTTFAHIMDRIKTIPGVSAVRDHRSVTNLDLVSSDKRFTVALVSMRAKDLGQAKAITSRVREALTGQNVLRFTIAGGPATAQELEHVSEHDARRAEIFGLPISLFILVIAFGAIIASALPLLVALASITVSLAALYGLGQLVEFAVFTQTVVTMLGLATGIDYALLMVNRFREELSTILVLLISVSVSVTALPATLALLGHRVNWLRVTRREPGLRSRSFWRARANEIMRHPAAWTLVGAAVLVAAGLPALWMQVADPGPRGLSRSTQANQTVRSLEQLGLEGLLSSYDVLIDFGQPGFYQPGNVHKVSELDRSLTTLGRVEAITSPMAAANVPRLFLYQYYASPKIALSSEIAPLARATISEAGRYALVRVFPKGPLTPEEGGALLHAIEQRAQALGLDIKVGGAYVQESEWAAVLYKSFPWAIALVYLATVIVLGLAFRSLLIPIKAIIMNTLTVAASYGIITLVFQQGVLVNLFGGGPVLGYIDTSAPLFIFAIVFGLSMDYEVFLVARIQEQHEHGASDREAVAAALSATGGVITSAAVVMITVFALFLLSHVLLVRTLGLGLSAAVLLDASLVRMALVPAVMTMAGSWNWWMPKPLARFVRRTELNVD
ncbi:MAG: MMPL family transporter [Deinococcales bacterium]